MTASPRPVSAVPSAFKSPIAHYWLDTWLLAALLEHATRRFCLRHLTRRIDPCGRLFDQMTMAARSAAANIAEGHARRSTSRETQIRLYDVARASLSELSGDFRSFLLLSGEVPWAESDPDARAVFAMDIAPFAAKTDIDRNLSLHILAHHAKFARWLDAEDALVPARALLVLLSRLQMMLAKQLSRVHADFLQNGGFPEPLSRERIATCAAAAAEANAPVCPKCGKPMRKRLAKRGVNAGKAFWSCPDYPACKGTRSAG